MKKEDILAINLIIRYFIIIASSFGSLYIFYLILTPLTIYPVFLILKIFINTTISNNSIIIGGESFELINACIAGAAYFILFMLNLATPNIKIKKRVISVLFSFLIFLILNILRILILIFVSIKTPALFILTHLIFWYALSTIFLVFIWIAEIKIFNFRSIPFYSDLLFLFNKSKFKRKK